MSPRSAEPEPPDYTGAETTGFVSPAGDSIEGPIDLSRVLELHRPNRYPVRVLGESLIERGILPGDYLIADAAAEPRPGAVGIVMLHGEVMVAQLAFRGGQWWLRPGRADRVPVPVTDDVELWAVVVALVRERV
ncbi:MAG: LexA family protein [Gammaproteobacteria bacterium]